MDMVMYGNEFETKENKIYIKDNIESQHYVGRSNNSFYILIANICFYIHVLITQGGTCNIHDGGRGCDEASYCEPKKIHEPEILHPKT